MANRAIKPDSGNQLVLQDEGGSAALTIETDGDVNLTQNIYLAAGKGIYFDGGTTSANFLGGSDAYEEGYHTVSITTSVGGSLTIDGSYNQISYTKIGRVVTVSGQLIISGDSSPDGYAKISIPFPIADLTQNAGRGVGSFALSDVASTNISNFVSIGVEGTSEIRLYLGDSTSFQSDAANQIQTNSVIYLTFTYFT